MLDFVTGLQVLLIVMVAITIFAGVWIIGECFDSWGDFIKSLTDKEYNYLSFVFRKGKHIRFITDFPNDLRRECLGKESYYADKEDDSAGARKAKMLVRRVLGNDAIVNEYFKGQYFTYKDFLEVKELCDLPEYDETSDLTYRIYDFGRLGLDGKLRELHTELAKDAIDYSVSEDYRTAYTPVLNEDTPLVECEYFKTHLLDLTEPLSVDVKSKDSFMIVICLEGKGVLKDSQENSITVKQGETILVPASTENVTFIPESKMEILTSWV